MSGRDSQPASQSASQLDKQTYNGNVIMKKIMLIHGPFPPCPMPHAPCPMPCHAMPMNRNLQCAVCVLYVRISQKV